MSYPRPSRPRTKPKPRRPKRNWGRIIILTLGIGAISFVLLLIASPFLLRSYRISKVPDAPVPFDTQAFGTVSIAPNENAFDIYKQASARLTRGEKSRELLAEWKNSDEIEDWNSIGPLVRQWMDQNRPGFVLFLEGTKRPDALVVQPKDYNVQVDLQVVQDLREFCRFATFEGVRLESEGDFAGAWGMYRAILISSRHCGMHAAELPRIVGVALHGVACDDIVRWARNPKLDAANLRKAIDDTREIYRRTAPPSVGTKVEYYGVLDGLANPLKYAENPTPGQSGGKPGQVGGFWFIGEPEVSHRYLRLAMTNWLSQMDLPRRERKAVSFPSGMEFFENPAGLTPQQLHDACERCYLGRLFRMPVTSYLNATDREQVKQSLLELHLAAQLYAREHELQLPDSLDQLVPQYVSKIPIDPYGPAVPLRYRREPGTLRATIWSVAGDDIDNSGNSNWKNDPAQNNGKGSGDFVLPAVREPK